MKNLTINVGDYVRNKYGIARVIEVSEDVYNHTITLKFDRDICFIVDKETGETKYRMNCLPLTNDIDIDKINFSPNIIDLIEVGDVLTLKEDDDVYRVIALPDKEVGLDDMFYFAKRYDGETEDIMIYKKTLEKEIVSIVTKEQFESMEYKIER